LVALRGVFSSRTGRVGHGLHSSPLLPGGSFLFTRKKRFCQVKRGLFFFFFGHIDTPHGPFLSSLMIAWLQDDGGPIFTFCYEFLLFLLFSPSLLSKLLESVSSFLLPSFRTFPGFPPSICNFDRFFLDSRRLILLRDFFSFHRACFHTRETVGYPPLPHSSFHHDKRGFFPSFFSP